MAFKYLMKVLEEVVEHPDTKEDPEQVELIVDEIKNPGEPPKPRMKWVTVAGCDDLGAAIDFVKKTLVNRYDPTQKIFIYSKDKDGADLEVDHFVGAKNPVAAVV
jgi:hypothetical protein